MSNNELEGNIAIAKMLGWLRQHFAEEFVEVKDVEIVGYLHAFAHLNYARTMTGKYQFSTSELRFHEDYNWQGLAIDFIHKVGTTPFDVNGSLYSVTVEKDKCVITNKPTPGTFHCCVQAHTRDAVFSSLVIFAQAFNNNLIPKA